MTREPVRIEEHRIVLDRAALRDLRERLGRTRWAPDLLPDGEQGVPPAWLRQLVEDWRAYDTDTLQDRLDALTHLRADIDGQSIHLVHREGAGVDPVPVVLTNGWPSSFLEHLPVLPLLTDPGSEGGGPVEAFSVVLPSLPGFGFSGPPPATGFAHRTVAALWHRLMSEGLGYDRYVAHGSDLGAGVTGWLARDHPDEVAGIHLATPGLLPGPEPRSPAEQSYAAAAEAWTAEEGGYAHQHATKPVTLGAALHDSPVGLAAWIGEKVLGWSSTGPDGQPAFDRDLLLATLTSYWVTGTITSSLLPYWTNRHTAGAALPLDDPSTVPTAVTIFGGEHVPFPKPPQELAERYYRLAAWNVHSTGGHFPAVAEPELLARTLRTTLPPLMQGGAR